MSQVLDIKLIHETQSGSLVRSPAKIEIADGRIFFLKSAFALKDEIKSMAGSRWHGYDDENPHKIWSVTDCPRNHFQLGYLMGEDVYEWFERDLIRHEYRQYQLKGVDTDPMPHQFDLADSGLTYHYQIWGAEMGTGKGGLPSTKVATPTGWTTLGEIQVGDEVINPEGGTTKVKGVYHRGRMEMFRVTFSDNSSTVCSRDHLWNVRSACRKHRGMSCEVLELQEILSRGLKGVANGNAKHYIPMVNSVEYHKAPLPVHPYLLGYILGNGGLSGYTNILSIPDTETVERLNSMMLTPLKQKKNSQYDYIIKDDGVNRFIEEAGLRGLRSHEKHLTTEYLFSAVENRIAILQGLCDSDGHAVQTSGVEYSTTSPDLCSSFVSLVQSLGGTCHVSESRPTYTYKGEKRVGRLAYRINASFPSTIVPFWLSRKASQYTVPTKYEPTRAIVKVESIGEEECICIAVEAANQLYVTDDFIVTHNTLAAQMVIEHSGVDWWYWVGPARSLPNMKREFRLWGFDESKIRIDFMSYEKLKRVVDEWSPDGPLPRGLICDESSRCKTYSSQRSVATQLLADRIRAKHRFDGYIIEMSGTPSPKRPTDWWSQCEIAWPGFLREGSVKALEQRLAFMVQKEFDSGTFWKASGWRDDERKCAVCGEFEEHPCHTMDNFMGEMEESDEEFHKFEPSKNEVGFMYERLKGLVVIKHKKDCLSLPDKRYRRVICKPKASVLRVAKALVDAAENAVTGMTMLRELSDGFQYREEPDGKIPCNHCKDACGEVDQWFIPGEENRTFSNIDMLEKELVARLEKRRVKCPKCKGTGEVIKMKRYAREVPCPKEGALRDLLEENEETGRLVIFAGFTGSVDRCCNICRKEGWSVVRCDGRGYQVTLADGSTVTGAEALDYWADLENNPRVAFVAHPESGGMSLTLVEARMAVYWSNSFKPEYRTQSEDRIHRKGMDENLGCMIVDLIHLPTDDRALTIIRENRKLELMTMGEVFPDFNPDEEPVDESAMGGAQP